MLFADSQTGWSNDASGFCDACECAIKASTMKDREGRYCNDCYDINN